MSKEYRGKSTKEISFPLGGIGTGSIGLAGNGSLIDWEINNRPNRKSINTFSHFSIKVEDEHNVLDARVLQGPVNSDFMGEHKGYHSWGYGHGPNRGRLAGLKHFSDVCFVGEFPIATIDFIDDTFPGKVSLEAFNPFIPTNDKDSSIPAAFYKFSVKNQQSTSLKYSIALSVTNPLKKSGPSTYHYNEQSNISSIQLESGKRSRCSVNYGNVSIATDQSHVSYQESWYGGGWFDDLTMFVNEFNTYGPLKNRKNPIKSNKNPITSTLMATIELEPQEEKEINFIVSWHVPQFYKYWIGTLPTKYPKLKNYYATLFNSSMESASYALNHWERLYDKTLLFKNTLLKSSMPEEVIDAIQGNLAILKSTTVLRVGNGDFFGWEGVNKNSGSCEGTCQHVWNYAYALPFLFPNLERNIRENEFKYSYRKSGKLNFRMMFPLGNVNHPFRACVDGQYGTIFKFYRDFKIYGDLNWLRMHWPKIKKAIAYAWSPKNPDQWDVHKSGVIFGRQHNTLDIEIYGAHAWLTGFYHAGLLAGAEMAQRLGDEEAKVEYLYLVEKGRAWIEENTFNGEYYTQHINIKSKELINQYGDIKNVLLNMVGGYWDEELGEVKYQFGEGCYIDQVVSDWHAGIIGLDEIYNSHSRKKALESIYDYNIKSAQDINNPCRVYLVNKEKGVINCTWPKESKKQSIPVPYAEEVFTGFEYAYAGSLLQVGFEDKALEIISYVRQRYDGEKRNPWAEIECGASYARAMSSYALLLIYSGFVYDMYENLIGFKPIKVGEFFWSIDGAWGKVIYTEDSLSIQVLYGSLAIKTLVHPYDDVKYVYVNGQPIDFENTDTGVQLDVSLQSDERISVMSISSKGGKEISC